MGIIRDFTADKKEDLKKLITDISSEDGWFGPQLIDYFFTDNSLSEDISSYGEDIKAYHQAILDKHETTAAQIDEIFANVYGVENSYKTRFKFCRDQIADATTAINRLALLLDVNSYTTPFLLETDPIKVAEKLNHATADFGASMNPNTRAQVIIDSMMIKDSLGNPTGEYNWDEIQRVLDKDTASISESEYQALASLYVNMTDVKDIEKFASLLAEYEGDVSRNIVESLIVAGSTDHSTWSYDATKVGNIQNYILIASGNLNVRIDAIREIDYEKHPEDLEPYRDEIEQWYATYPERVEGASLREMCTAMYGALERLNLAYTDKFVLLDTLVKISDISNFEASLGISVVDYPGINGAIGAFGPTLVISQDGADRNDDYVLKYQHTSSTTSGSSDVMMTSFNDMTERTIIIGSSRTSKGALREYMLNTTDYINGIYGYTVEGVVGGSAVETGVSITAGMVFSEMAEGAGYAKLAKVPVIDIAFGLLEIPLEISEMNQGLKDNEKQIKLGKTASMVMDFDMNISFIKTSDDPKETYAVVTSGSGTSEIIENINRYIEVNGVDISKYELEYPLTFDAIKSNPEAIDQLIYKDIYAIEYDKYGSENGAVVSLGQMFGEGHFPPEILFSSEYQ